MRVNWIVPLWFWRWQFLLNGVVELWKELWLHDGTAAQQSRDSLIRKMHKSCQHIFRGKHTANAGEDGTSGRYLDGDFNRRHGQVGAILSPCVDQLSTQSQQGLRKRCLAIVVQTWWTHHWLLMVHTDTKKDKKEICNAVVLEWLCVNWSLYRPFYEFWGNKIKWWHKSVSLWSVLLFWLHTWICC